VFLFRLAHRECDFPSQQLIPREAKQVIRLAFFRPGHQPLPEEDRIGAQQNPPVLPPPANLLHDALHFLLTSRAGVEV
jgi:hypothetical protein